MCTNKVVMFSNWTVSCLKRHSQYNLKHTYQISDRDLQLQLQLMYTIVHLLDISNRKHIRRSSYVINLKHCTSISLTVKPICFFLVVRHSSHQGGSLQNRLGDEQTCGTILALAYVLCCLSATWSQLQMKKRKSEWKWVLIGVSPLNTGGQVQ